MPAADATSRLSPHLAFGEISARQIWRAATARGHSAATEKFLAELGWREFAYHLLFHFGDLGQRNFRSEFDAFPWSDDGTAIEAWRRGRTGYPIVDAGMENSTSLKTLVPFFAPMKNRLFRRLLLVFIINGSALGVAVSVMLFYVEHVLKGGKLQAGIILLVYFGAAALSVPMWLMLSRRYTKTVAWFIAMRSVSGWSVASISSIHQLRSSRPCSCNGRSGCNGLPSTPAFFFASAASARAAWTWRCSSAGPSFSQPGGGVMASRRTLASKRSTVAT